MKIKTTAVMGLALVLGACCHHNLEKKFVKQAGDRVFFDVNRNDLTDAAKAELDRQAAWIIKHPKVKAVVVTSDCDDTGTSPYNMALSQRRANAARSYLIAKGVKAVNIQTVARGMVHSHRDDAKGRAKNRNAITAVR